HQTTARDTKTRCLQRVRVPGEGIEPSRPLAGTADFKSLRRLSDPLRLSTFSALRPGLRPERRACVYGFLRGSYCRFAVTFGVAAQVVGDLAANGLTVRAADLCAQFLRQFAPRSWAPNWRK